ncbi:ferredoxin [Kitasatospora sp. NPDC127111]|uniref:ferredoxin n=1 Tax=Kitasatospora sp. NPDC127111 TaxID=3345363 RepID=UPI003635DB56
MRVVVDLNRCQGYAQCAFLAPEVFRMHGDEALLYAPRAGTEQRERLARAVAACPVQAILVDDGDEGQGAAPPGGGGAGGARGDGHGGGRR